MYINNDNYLNKLRNCIFTALIIVKGFLMENLSIHISLVNNSTYNLDDQLNSCGDYVKYFAGDDTGAPVANVSMRATTEDGKLIQIIIPNDNTSLKAKINLQELELDEYKVKSTSKNSAECDEIVLRSTDTTRLVFKPIMVNNDKNKYASVKGHFVFQKKNKAQQWENLKSLHLSNLKSEEWVKLELKSAELLTLIKELIALYRASWKDGIPFGEVQYIKTEGNLKELANLTHQEIEEFFKLNKKSGLTVFSKLLNYVSKFENPEEITTKLEELDVTSIGKLNSIIGINQLKKGYEIWLNNNSNSDEEFWQNLFTQNSYLITQLFSYPVVFVKGKAYVGGKSIENKKGNIVDFLLKNQLTENSLLLEIKTPVTKMIGSLYRGDIYNISQELTGAVIQLTNYKNNLLKSYYAIKTESEYKFEIFNPKCILIAGNIESELIDTKKRKSLELFRNGLNEIQIVTYDELFGKINFLIKLLEGSK